MGLHHDPYYPPLGQYKNARIIQDDQNIFYLIADIVMFDKVKSVAIDEDLILSYSDESKGFLECYKKTRELTRMHIDLLSFNNENEVNAFAREISEIDEDIQIAEKIRKSLLNDPEVIIELGKLFVLYSVLKPIGEKIADKLSDNIASDVLTYYNKLKSIALKCFQYLRHHNRPILFIIEIPTDTIILELYCRVTKDNIERFIDAIEFEKIREVYEKSLKLEKTISGKKFQYLLNGNGDWKLNYLLTEKGEVIGKKKLVEERDRVYKQLLDRGALYNSIGASIGGDRIKSIRDKEKEG